MEPIRMRFFDESGTLLFDDCPEAYKETKEFYRIAVYNGISVYEEQSVKAKAAKAAPQDIGDYA